jgi:hypothetical protein
VELELVGEASVVLVLPQREDGVEAVSQRPQGAVEPQDTLHRAEFLVVLAAHELAGVEARRVVRGALGQHRARVGLHLDVELRAVGAAYVEVEHDGLVVSHIARDLGVEHHDLGQRLVQVEHRLDHGREQRDVVLARQEQLEDDVVLRVEHGAKLAIEIRADHGKCRPE